MNVIEKNDYVNSLKSPEGVTLASIVLLNKNIDTELVEEIILQIRTAIANGQTIVPLIVDSSGGSVHAAQTLIDFIEHVHATTPVKIATFARGFVASSAVDVLVAGARGYRFASPSTYIMLHLTSMNSGDDTDTDVHKMLSDARYFKRLHKETFRRMDSHCGKESGFFMQLLERKAKNGNLYLKAERALHYGIVDVVGWPTLECSVHVDYSLTVKV